jgi:hypothetical protein
MNRTLELFLIGSYIGIVITLIAVYPIGMYGFLYNNHHPNGLIIVGYTILWFYLLAELCQVTYIMIKACKKENPKFSLVPESFVIDNES